MLIRFILHIIASGLAILVAARYVPGVVYSYEPLSLMKIALILALANSLLKPVLNLILSPIIFITLGLFTIVINVFLVWIAVYFVPELSINGYVAYLLTMILVSFFNFLVSTIAHKEN